MTALFRKISALVAERGIITSLLKLAAIFRHEGATGVRSRLRFIKRRLRISNNHVRRIEVENKLAMIPLYLELLAAKPVESDLLTHLKVAVHLHLYHVERLPEFLRLLNQMPLSFDLYVSVPLQSEIASIANDLQCRIERANIIAVETVPDRGRDIAPFIAQFGSRLLGYDIVGHFRTEGVSRSECLENRYRETIGLLIGSDGVAEHLTRIFGLLRSEAKVIYAEGKTCSIDGVGDKSGWSENVTLAGRILEAHTSLSISDFTEIEFPEETMFWARANCIAEFLLLPFSYDDFPEGPVVTDGTLFHALKRLPLVLASLHPGICIRLHRRDSIKDYRCYEEQEDFSGRRAHSDIRVLSYYLPQFHQTPENDL